MTSSEWKVMKKKWQDKAEKILLGKHIIKVEWMTDEECEEMMWSSKPVCFQLDDGTWLYPSQDDEGNNGGALDCTSKGVLPVMSIGD